MPCDRAIDLQFPGQPIWAQRVYEIPASVPSTELNPTLRSVDTHGPWKSVIGPKLKSRSFSRQITEIQVGQKVLNTMTALGRPVFERIA